MVGPPCVSIFLIKRKLKDNFVFLRVLMAKIDREEGFKFIAIESLGIQIERF
jgi:hypothetical protein